MKGRWTYAIAAALYLLPQLGFALHHDEAAEACGSCEERPAAPLLECGDEDCGQSSHHHHRGHVHHAASCRACPAATHVAIEAAQPPAPEFSVTVERAETVRSTGSPSLVARDPRGPPAA